ncbi:DUF2092 domain-containing protein [Streptomyces sp. CAU 1734]|uniref:LolA family protein n=1 Tax=Streptomyces sp. CAU 1734 TaxID=3140360 RepID=UPI0032617AC5
MAPNDSAHSTDESRDVSAGRRKAARYLVPVAVAGFAAATIGLVPALAASGDPDLPEISAQELIEKIAASDTERLSGTVKISTDLGLPDFAGLADNFTPGPGSDGGKSSAAAPQEKLMELATGSHTLRVAVDGPDRQKVSILGNSSEYSLIQNKGEVWAYDSAANTVFHGEGEPGGGKGGKKAPHGAEDLPTLPKDFAAEALKAVGDTTSVSVDGTAQVAGRDAYQLVIKPKQSGSTIGSVKIAVDSKTGTPLRLSVNSSSGGKAVVEIGFTKVDFSAPDASVFDFKPPKGAKVTEADELEKELGDLSADTGKGLSKDQEAELEKLLGEGKAVNAEAGGGPLGLGAFPEGAEVIGEGWTSIAKFGGSSDAAPGAEKEADIPAEAGDLLGMLGDRVTGDFGSGTIVKTRLVNALMTDDGTVYAGAVTKGALLKAANADSAGR